MQMSSPIQQAEVSCKIIRDSDELPRSSKQWTRARKCTLRFLDNGLAYDDTFTPYDSIENGVIHIYQSAFFFEFGILSITTGGKTNHFGIKYSDLWKGELPFPVERIHEDSPFILFRRTLIILILLYIFWEVVKR